MPTPDGISKQLLLGHRFERTRPPVNVSGLFWQKRGKDSYQQLALIQDAVREGLIAEIKITMMGHVFQATILYDNADITEISAENLEKLTVRIAACCLIDE